MENQKYKEMFQDMLWAEDFDFGFVSGSKHKFYIKAAGYRITWDRKAKTIMLPSMADTDIHKNAPTAGMLTASQMMSLLKGEAPDNKEYYIPTSQEDEFQASTAMVGHILPYELVEYLERLLSVARECISQYSIDERKYK